MDYVLQTFDLSKQYKKHKAVDRACMNIARGDIYGFVGENGSGKTTIIRMITGLIYPTGGRFRLFGVKNADRKINEARSKVGAVVETPSIYPNMSARDNLLMQCKILGAEESLIPEILETVGLGDLLHEKKHAGDFSLGMRQRLGIAMALMGKPEFLILDEPMNGLDPAGIVDVRELILRLNREQGITFLISSHILTELSLVATKYGIISKGRIICEITDQELHQQCGKQLLLRAENMEQLLETVRQALPEHTVTVYGDCVKVSGEVDLNSVLAAILESGNTLQSINCMETGFEEFYLSLIGGGKNG